MARNTNMDHSRKVGGNIPQLEFTLLKSELDSHPQQGQKGELRIPVEVTEETNDSISFRKSGKAHVMGEFRQASLIDMETDLGEGSQPEDRKRK